MHAHTASPLRHWRVFHCSSGEGWQLPAACGQVSPPHCHSWPGSYAHYPETLSLSSRQLQHFLHQHVAQTLVDKSVACLDSAALTRTHAALKMLFVASEPERAAGPTQWPHHCCNPEGSAKKCHDGGLAAVPNFTCLIMYLSNLPVLLCWACCHWFLLPFLCSTKRLVSCRQEPAAAAAAGTKRPRSQDDAEPLDSMTSAADAPAALATADGALSESADTAAVAAAIAATDRADAVLHNVSVSSQQSLPVKTLVISLLYDKLRAANRRPMTGRVCCLLYRWSVPLCTL